MTKPKEKTREELQAEIEDGKKKIRQFENREKMLRQKLSKEERRTRSHRLIVRGAVFESIVPEAKDMTDEEAAALLRLVREYCSSQFVSRGMCVDFAIHDTDSGNPHCHIMLTMRPLDERGTWAAKSKKEYDLDENGERIRLPSGRYKTHKVDLTGWNDKDNTLLWRKAWADFTNDFLERNGSPERIDHRSNAESGIDEIPTVHMGVAACQMEKKGIATEKGELNRNIQKVNLLIREIRAQIGKLKEWIKDAKSVTLASSNLPRRETTRGTIAYRKNRKLGKPSTHD